MAELRQIIDASGAHQQVEDLIGSLADRAVAALGTSSIDAHAGVVLTELASAATQRTV